MLQSVLRTGHAASERVVARWESLGLAGRFIVAAMTVMLCAMTIHGLWLDERTKDGVVHSAASGAALYINSAVEPHLQDLKKDRTLSPDGGNPNLLWSHRQQKLHVIDHNLAFDDSDLGGFWDEHIFHNSVSDWTDGFRVEMGILMKATLADLPHQWQEMPEQWTEIDSGIELSAVQIILSRFERNTRTFWRT